MNLIDASVVSVDDLQDVSGNMNAWPSVTNDPVILRLPEHLSEHGLLELIDPTGRVTRIYPEYGGQVQFRLDLNGKANGMYIIRLSDNMRTGVVRVVKSD